MNAMPNLVLATILDSHVSLQWRSCGKLFGWTGGQGKGGYS